MELIFRLLALCILAAVLALLLREEKQVLAIFVIIALVVVAVPLLLEPFSDIFAVFDQMIAMSMLSSEIFTPMVKVVGIAAVTKVGCSLCKEADSDTAAALLEMGGTCCALLTALPLVSAVLTLLQQML